MPKCAMQYTNWANKISLNKKKNETIIWVGTDGISRISLTFQNRCTILLNLHLAISQKINRYIGMTLFKHCISHSWRFQNFKQHVRNLLSIPYTLTKLIVIIFVRRACAARIYIFFLVEMIFGVTLQVRLPFYC